MSAPHNPFPGTYDAAALAVMQEAFEAAWKVLAPTATGDVDSLRTALANAIITNAEDHRDDPDGLKQAALRTMGR